MKNFHKFRFDPKICRQELNELKSHLDSNTELIEREDVLPFFQARMHLSAYIGSYLPYISSFDRLAFEYDIFGDFKADLVVGDSIAGVYVFIEFEGASPTSIFKRAGSKATPEWSARFEHGFSQTVDWLWKLSLLENHPDFTYRFNTNFVSYEAMLIIGRSEGLEQRELARLRWRREKLIVNSRPVYCITFDELYCHLDTRLRTYEAAYLADEG